MHTISPGDKKTPPRSLTGNCAVSTTSAPNTKTASARGNPSVRARNSAAQTATAKTAAVNHRSSRGNGDMVSNLSAPSDGSGDRRQDRGQSFQPRPKAGPPASSTATSAPATAATQTAIIF